LFHFFSTTPVPLEYTTALRLIWKDFDRVSKSPCPEYFVVFDCLSSSFVKFSVISAIKLMLVDLTVLGLVLSIICTGAS
jgi:hypothetical protein